MALQQLHERFRRAFERRQYLFSLHIPLLLLASSVFTFSGFVPARDHFGVKGEIWPARMRTSPTMTCQTTILTVGCAGSLCRCVVGTGLVSWPSSPAKAGETITQVRENTAFGAVDRSRWVSFRGKALWPFYQAIFCSFCFPTHTNTEIQISDEAVVRLRVRRRTTKMAQRPGGVGAGAELHRVLQDCKLLEYEPLLLEEGEAFVVS